MDGLSWIRLVEPAGVELPTTPVKGKLSCGTGAVAWMEGHHPSILEGIVSRKICFSWGLEQCFGNTNNNTNTFYINVAACSGLNHDVFYVYQLKRPSGCDFAYCGVEKSKEGPLTSY